jgi:hypothetical protein
MSRNSIYRVIRTFNTIENFHSLYRLSCSCMLTLDSILAFEICKEQAIDLVDSEL